MAGYRVRAEEADPGSRTRGQVIFSILFLLLVVFCDVLLGRMLYDSMTDVDAIQVKQLKVEGGLHYLSEKKVADYFLSNYDNLNLLTMDLSKVRRYLLNLPTPSPGNIFTVNPKTMYEIFFRIFTIIEE